MWSDQILKVMLKDCTSASVLTGIYSIDTLPTHIEYPAALIVNLSPSTSTGTHWTAIYIDQLAHGKYFDSFGRDPPKPILKFMQRNCKLFRVNQTQYQHENSLLCGSFCIVFIYFCVRGKNILSSFHTSNIQKNDAIVKKLVQNIVKQNNKCE